MRTDYRMLLLQFTFDFLLKIPIVRSILVVTNFLTILGKFLPFLGYLSSSLEKFENQFTNFKDFLPNSGKLKILG